MSIFLDVMKEELERNIYKQNAFINELNNLPKGYLSECLIDNRKYVYRKYRVKDKIVSEYVGVPGDDAVLKAYEDRANYIKLSKAIKLLKKEEQKLRKAIKDYEKLWIRNG